MNTNWHEGERAFPELEPTGSLACWRTEPEPTPLRVSASPDLRMSFPASRRILSPTRRARFRCFCLPFRSLAATCVHLYESS